MVLQQAEIVVDVVLSDIEMPGAIDGSGLSRWVRAKKTGLEVILGRKPVASRRRGSGLV